MYSDVSCEATVNTSLDQFERYVLQNMDGLLLEKMVAVVQLMPDPRK